MGEARLICPVCKQDGVIADVNVVTVHEELSNVTAKYTTGICDNCKCVYAYKIEYLGKEEKSEG